MTAPNIDMIANSLLRCSLNYQNTSLSSSSPFSSSSSSSTSPANSAALYLPPPPLTEGSDFVTVELNSDLTLPFQWEQCLDIRTGEVYYINWQDGTRTTTDPRTLSFSFSSSYQEEQSDSNGEINAYDSSSEADSCSGVNASVEPDSTESSRTSNMSSTLSSFSPTESSSSGGVGAIYGTGADTGTGSQVLVAAGCKMCFMYFMIPKHEDICPKCGGDGLLHLGRA